MDKDSCATSRLEAGAVQTFFSTLVQTTATLLGILAAGVAAFYVFLQERSAQYDSRIEDSKSAIREILLTLGSSRHVPVFLPPDFRETARSKFKDVPMVDLIGRAAPSLFFDDGVLQAAVEEAEREAGATIAAPWEGRTFLWLLGEAVDVVTARVGDVGQDAPAVFPNSALGPGFDEWRRDFQKVSTAAILLRYRQQEWIRDYDKFMQARYQGQHSDFVTRAQSAAAHFSNDSFFAIERVNRALGDIDRESVLKSQYSFSERVHLRWLLILSSLSFLLGLALPMWFLLWNKETSLIAGTVYWIAVVAVTVGAFVQFSSDLAHPHGLTRSYVRARWLEPIVKASESMPEALNRGDTINVEQFNELLLGTDGRSLSMKMTTAIEQFATKTKAYNDISTRLANKMIALVQADPVLAPRLKRPPQARVGGESTTFVPMTFLDPEQFKAAVDDLKMKPANNLSFETPMHLGAATLGTVASANRPAISDLATGLEAVRHNLVGSQEAAKFESTRAQVRASLRPLREAIGNESN